MKLLVDIDGQSCTLETESGENPGYRLHGAIEASGRASIVQISPGVFSVLLGNRSYTARITRSPGALEVWIGNRRHTVSLSDIRDRSKRSEAAIAAGPQEVRAQMPGKIIKILAGPGTAVEAGQGLVVIEAMKMQNELKSPKKGKVTAVHVAEGAAVSAGERLMVIE